MSLITLVSTWMLALALAVGQTDAQPMVRFVMLVRAAVAHHHVVRRPEPAMIPATDSDRVTMPAGITLRPVPDA